MKQAGSSQQQKARLQAEVIMKVRCGLLTAQQAAEHLGVSRKTYYKWEERGLSALLSSLADQARGRPCQPVDSEKLSLQQQLEQAHRECAIWQHKMALKDVLTELKLTPGMSRAEKNERIQRVVAMIAEAKTRFALPLRALACEMCLGVATLSRWRRRLTRGQAAVGRRGPRKVKPLNLSELKDRIKGLGHGGKRSRGSGRLHRAYGAAISRRDLDAMVRTVRSETSRQRRVEMYHVRWLRPNLAWAMDDCEKTEDGAHGTLHLHNQTDLHSRYRLPPLAADRLPCGEELAGHLQNLFERFDPPLFCKRDNGGNLNHLAVNQVLEEALVIPVNSPPYRAPYNGGIEHTQGEFKSYLDRWSWKTGTVDKMALLSETAAHDLNHQPRRCLGGKSACRAYFGGPRIRYPRRKRAAVYSRIHDLAAELSTRAENSVIPPVAWRVAARQWLVKNGLIMIQKTGKVSPNFLKKSDHI